MRNVEAHLLEDKMDEAVTHYINTHHSNEPVHIDTNGIPMTVQDDGAGRVTVMHQQTYTTQMCRQVSVTEQVGEGPWGEELLEGPIAAIVAHLQNSRHHPPPHHKVTSVRNDVDTSVILDGSMRFNGQALDQQAEPLVVQLPPMQTLPPLQDMKRCAEPDWFSDKNKKDDASMLQDSDSQVLEMNAGASPAQNKQQSKKSLPHKKRISRKLKRNNGNSTPQQELVVINCSSGVGGVGGVGEVGGVGGVSEVGGEGAGEQILPDNYVAVPHHTHISHEVRPMFICQICGDYYGEEQLKFYHHLKQHYEPHTTIIIENPVPDMAMDKMANNCIVDNVATLPDSIVELSLENTVPKTMYQPIDKHILYTSSDKTLTYNSNKVQYSMASMDKEPSVPTSEAEKSDLYDTLDKLELYNCGKCSKTFRKQKQCEAHMREMHSSNTKLEDMGEFSEPEDLMAGIQVCVDGEQYEQTLLPHLTVENGHVHQEHTRHWYPRGGSAGAGAACAGAYCGVCARDGGDAPPLKVLKEEVLQRIFDNEVSDNANFPDNILPDNEVPEHEHSHEHGHPHEHENLHEHENVHEQVHEQSQSHGHEVPSGQHMKEKQEPTNSKGKRFSCPECSRVFIHRNSLLYHVLSHAGKQHLCRDCGKGFYTHGALKIHKRVHNGDRPYKCEICGREFRQWSDLRYHKVSLHTDKKNFKCEFCGKEFARKYSLNVHVRIHTGERNYKCEYCSKTFRASSYRLTHMRTHTGDRPHKCEQCDKSFRSTFDLRRHLLVHDKVRNRFDEPKTKPKDVKKTKMTDTKEEKPESPPKVKKIAVASTAKLPATVKVQKKKSPGKKGVPNVTVQTKDGPFKNNDYSTSNVESFDRQVDYSKYKDEYSENETKSHISETRELAILRPIFRGSNLDNVETEKQVYRENTDGKMQVFTHVEKNKDVSIGSSQVLGDMRHLEREVREVRSEISGEGMETGFLERLTAMYNIAAV